MALEDFAWTDAPEPKQHGARWLGWTTFWLVVIGAAVSLGWVIAGALTVLDT